MDLGYGTLDFLYREQEEEEKVRSPAIARPWDVAGEAAYGLMN